MAEINSSEFMTRISEPGKGLLADPISEVTKRRQVHLLISSVITILLSNGILIFEEGSLAGLNFSTQKSNDLVLISGLVCCYLFVMYSFYLYRDWKLTRYIRLPLHAEIHTLRNLVQEEMVNRFKRQQSRSAATSELLDARREKWNEYKVDSIEELDESFMDRMNRFLEYCETDGLDKIQDEALKTAFDEGLSKKATFIAETLITSHRIDNIRVFAEVLFPAGLGVYAILAAGLFVV